MDAIEALHTRYSIPRLADPAPSEQQLEVMFKAAFRAPDHAQIKPWRFVVVTEERRAALGELWAEAVVQSDGSASDALVEKTRTMPMRAPMIIIAICQYEEHPKVPRIEQVVSTGAAVQNVLLAAHAQGFSAYWRTGALAHNPALKERMQLKPDDEIVGFIYMGTAACTAKPPKPVPQADFVRYY